ncbi:GPI transamidase component PIG-T-like protein, partial [Leptotrombidium deliense]
MLVFRQILFFWSLIFVANANSDVYKERLLIKPLPEGQVYAYFEFTTLLNTSVDEIFWVNHFNFFPLSLGKFIASAKIQEIHFSLTKGFWRNNIWGYAVRDAPS